MNDAPHIQSILSRLDQSVKELNMAELKAFSIAAHLACTSELPLVHDALHRELERRLNAHCYNRFLEEMYAATKPACSCRGV